MRRIAGVLLALLGLCVAVLGAALAILLGTDNRATTGPHPIDADTVAVATAPGAIEWAGANVTIVAEVPDRKPVFIGIGNAVDVDDYLSDTRAVRIEGYEVPWTVETSRQDGRRWLPATPLALDWWKTESSGRGGAAIAYELPDEAVSVAVLAVGNNDLSGLEITAEYHVRGGFAIGLGTVAIGLGLVLAGWLVFRGFRRDRVVDDDGFVYVAIDEAGNERAVPLDELDDYDIVDITGEDR